MSSAPATPAEAIDTLRDALLDLAHTAPGDITTSSDPADELATYRRFVRRTAARALATTAGAAAAAGILEGNT